MKSRTRATSLRRPKWAAWVVCAAALAGDPLVGRPAYAYQDEADAPKAAAPKPGKKAAAEEEGPADGAPVGLAPPRNANARILLESPPKSPEAIIETAALLPSFDAGEHGRELLKPLLATPPTAPALVSLYEKLGPATFAKLETTPTLQPEGRELTALVREAVRARSQDPAYIEKLIDRLNTPDRRLREYVAVKLREGGPTVYQPLIAALADPARQAMNLYVRQAMVVQGTAIGPAVQAALATDDPAQAASLAMVLRDLRYREATIDLVGPAADANTPQPYRDEARAIVTKWLGAVPDQAEAVKAILGAADAVYERATPAPTTDDEGQTTIWSWDSSKREVVSSQVIVDDAYAIRAAQLGAEALRLAPDDANAQRFAAASALEAALLRKGLDQKVTADEVALVAKTSDESLKQVIAKSLGTRHTPAAIAAVGILAEREHKDVLASPDGRLPLLVQAAIDPDRRLRVAAAEAIFGIEPTGDYVGSSLVLESLTQLVTGTGKPKAIVAHHILQDGQTLAGQLNELGYEADLAFSGRELFKKCATQADVELVLVSVGVIDPQTLYAIADLRHDPRTAELPIAVIADPEHNAEAHRVADRDPLSVAIVRPVTPSQLTFLLKPLLERRARPSVVASPERLEQAKRAIALVAAASRENSPGYDLLRIEPALLSVLFTPELYASACEALSNIKSRAAQLGLLDLASLAVQPEDVRRTAVEAFAHSVDRFGTLLTATEVQRQYIRYNESADAEEATQQILAASLDAIEKKAKDQAAKDGAKEDKPKES